MTPGRRLSRTDLLLALALGVIVLGVVVPGLVPRPASVDERVQAIGRQLRCPTCRGLAIADSPSTAASQMREVVREQVVAGATDDEVRSFFVARYGRWVLLDPPPAGIDLALWLVPGFAVVGGAAIVVRRARAPGGVAAPARAWHARTFATGRLPAVLTATGMVLALALPIGGAIGPRIGGQQVTGSAPQAAPTIEELERVVRGQPGSTGALVALGDALLAAGRPGDAAERYRSALEVDAENVPALLGIGTILLAADRPDAAGPVFDRVLAIVPDQPDALLYRAVARLRIAGTPTDAVRSDVQRFLEVASDEDPRRTMATRLIEDPGRVAPLPSIVSAPSPTGG